MEIANFLHFHETAGYRTFSRLPFLLFQYAGGRASQSKFGVILMESNGLSGYRKNHLAIRHKNNNQI
jgi:hypothetical protein